MHHAVLVIDFSSDYHQSEAWLATDTGVNSLSLSHTSTSLNLRRKQRERSLGTRNRGAPKMYWPFLCWRLIPSLPNVF